jgi:hypothetical protein
MQILVLGDSPRHVKSSSARGVPCIWWRGVRICSSSTNWRRSRDCVRLVKETKEQVTPEVTPAQKSQSGMVALEWM